MAKIRERVYNDYDDEDVWFNEKKVSKPDEYDVLSVIEPSFRELKPHYSKVCQRRIRENVIKAKENMELELKYHQSMQKFALSGERLHRLFLTGFTVPKRFKDTFSRSERIRIDAIINNRFN